ncbi:MAG: polysaccharide deacetylase family protein [Verrucomicrobia bacterium]|nr:polysaccharide deacetylase family protein [Verrucomicrobiota bacterium]MDA1067512.1 polysaccharide deacetylase family protein [Verrucomicrobiota bacterium]
MKRLFFPYFLLFIWPGLLFGASDKKVVVLTFDDAVKSHRTFVAPYLKELGFGATFFVSYKWMDDSENFMSWEEIKEIHEMGFEIGNHTWTHRDMGNPDNAHRLAGELGLINFMLQKQGLPDPVTFAYPGNKFGPEAFKILLDGGYQFARRGMQPEIEYGKRQIGPLYDPAKHHPLLVPTTADAYPDWDLEYFKQVVDTAEAGKFVILQFHGVPDIAHPWVHTDQENFKEFMQYLKEQNLKVISLGDLARYLPTDYVPPDDPLIGYHFSGKKEINLLTSEQEATREDLEYWVDNMRRFHGFSWEEVAQVTGYSVEEIKGMSKGYDKVIQPSEDVLTILPYPGGRHPRIGFLEGMIDPMRGTKLSIFLPWDKSQYVILDVPEALFCQLGVTFLGHTHVPTIWDRDQVTISNSDWSMTEAGAFENSWELPNGMDIGVVVTPLRDSVEMELTVHNGSDVDMEFINGQVCIMLKGATEFDLQTKDNKVLTDTVAAVQSENKNRWILTQWDQLRRTWGNDNCPCLHFDPILNPCKVGETVKVKGRIWFHEGEELPSEFAIKN